MSGSRALFRAPVENRLSFSVTAPAPGDYYVVLDNRRAPMREPSR